MSVDPWAGLHVAGLCVGVGNYRYEDKLDNAVRDAEEVNKRLNSVPNCHSAFLENPSTTSELLRKIIACLQEPGLREMPPELFLFYYAGHAIQLNSKVYLVPRLAHLDKSNMYDVECLTLDKLLATLRNTLDLPVRSKMHRPRSISFLVVLDCCRNSIDDALACEPAPQSMPNNTTILFSCSRTKKADDGPSGGHSPFAQALLHAKHGFFAEGATLEEAFSHIGAGALDSQACGQKPIIIGPAGAIPPQFRIWSSPDPQTNPCRGAGDSTLCNSAHSSGSSTSATAPSVIGRTEGKRRADNPQEGAVAKKISADEAVTKKPQVLHAAGGGGGGGCGSQGSGGGFAASLDSTEQAFPYDVFISHAWDKDDEGRAYRDNHERAKRMNAGLQDLGMKTWFHDEQMQGDILDCMTRGIKGSAVVLICVTRRYAEKVTGEADSNCKLEFNYAYGKRTSVFMLPVVMEESMTHKSAWGDRLFAVLGFHFYHKLTSDTDDEFDKAVSEIAAAVRTKIDENLLPDLQQATSRIVQDAMCAREPSLTPSDQSDMSTAPQSPSSPSQVMGFHVESTISAFRDDMKKFMQDFLHRRRLCELLLVAFMRDKVAPSCDVKMARNLETWQEKCEDLDANLVICFNKIMRTLKPSILKEQLNYEFSNVNEKNHTSVFVINWMVQCSPWALNETKIVDWIEEVVKDFDPSNEDSANCFLERSEKFLQKGVKGEKWGIKILGKVIEINSYVAFFRMKALAALLLREYCSQQKISHAHQQKQHDAQEAAKKPQCTLPLAIGLIVSSSNWHVSFSTGKGPSSACVSEMAWHLQRIACLFAETLETNEYSFSQLESVKCEPLYNLKAHKTSALLQEEKGNRFSAALDLKPALAEFIGKDSCEQKAKRPSSGTPNGERPPKKMHGESKNLDFSSPPTVEMNNESRRTRSGKTYMPQNEEEIEQEEVFMEREGTLEEKALNLVTQLKDRIKGFFYDESDGEDDDEDEGLNSSSQCIIDATESFEQHVADEKSRVQRSIVFLGHNGNGKSFLINLALQVTQVREPQYGLNGIESRMRAPPKDETRLRTWLFRHMEGVLELRNNNSTSNGCVTEDAVEFSSISSTEKDGHYIPKEKREKEEKVLQKFRDAHKSGPPDKEYKDGFMLPSEGNAKSTTQIVVKIRQGTVYHMVIRYKTEHDIREELGNHNWEQLEDDSDDEMEPDAVVNNKYKCEMLLRVKGLDPKEHEHEEVDKPKAPGEVQICDAIKAKLDLGFEIFSGRGRKLLDDRLYVRNKLWDVMGDPQLAYIIHECIVYVPADVVEGLELMDAPGTGVESPQEQLRLTEALRTADAIVVTMQRNLEDDKDVKPALEKCGVFKKIIGKSQPCRVFLFSAMDEARGFSKLNTKEAGEKFQKNVEELRSKNVKGLKTLLKKTFKSEKRKDKDMTEDMMLAACLPALEADMFQSYPLLWASLALSSGEKDEEEKISRSEKEKLLCGVSKMLSAIKEFSRSEPLATVMKDFLDKIKSVEFSQTVKVDPAVTPAALTENMRKVAKKEASKQAFRNKKIHVEEMKRQFELEVYIPLRKEHDTFIVTTLAAATGKMLENVDVEDVKSELHKKMTDTRKWRTLQTAFKPEYRGAYKKLDLFNSFFGNFTLPSTDELEKSIEKLREFAKDQVQKFMIDQMIAYLQSSEGTGTRASHAEGVSDAVKALVEKVVEECISISQSKTLDEALTLLKPKSLSLLTKNKSLKKVLDDSQIESLKNNLLNDPDIRNATAAATTAATTVKGGRKKEVKSLAMTLQELYKRKVTEKAGLVITGAIDIFSEKIAANGQNLVLEELKDRFVERRGRRGKEPVIFKFWRECFKRIADLDESESDLTDDKNKCRQQLLDEFKDKWQDLQARAMHEMPLENAEKSHRRFQESIYLRHFLRFLESEYQLPTQCKARKMRVAKCELEALAPSDTMKVIRMMKEGASHESVDADSYLEFKNQLKVWKLKLGYCKYDKHCLFRTLYQILHGKDSEEEMQEEGGGGSSDTGAADRNKKVIQLRHSIVRMVLEKHQTKEQLQTFEKCWNESVEDWARRMKKEEEYGDTVCIEYFARHFRVTIRVYTPVCEEPLQFPMYLEQQEEIVVGNIKSVYRIAHVPFKSGEEVRPNYYVPVWAGGVSFTPHSTPPHTYERDGDTPMASTSARLATERAKRRDTAGTRMTAAATEEDRDMVRARQVVNKYWSEHFSPKRQQYYYLHKESETSVWSKDFLAVRTDEHPTIKIPDGMRK